VADHSIVNRSHAIRLTILTILKCPIDRLLIIDMTIIQVISPILL